MEDDLWRKTNFCGTRPSVEDNLQWKTTFGGSQPIIWELGGGEGVSNKFKGCSKVFQGWLKDFLKGVSMVFYGCFQEISRVVKGCFKRISRKFMGCVKSISCVFQEKSRLFHEIPKVVLLLTECFKEITRCSKKVLRVFQGNANGDPRLFQGL